MIRFGVKGRVVESESGIGLEGLFDFAALVERLTGAVA